MSATALVEIIGCSSRVPVGRGRSRRAPRPMRRGRGSPPRSSSGTGRAGPREPVGAGLLDGVLGGDDHERAPDVVRGPVDGDVALLHHLEQCRLGLRRRPVDLVGEHDGGEDRAPCETPTAPLFWSYMVMPVMSEGSRSGVNWIRLWDPWTVAAMARARAVFPVPGASSSRRCPSVSRQVSASRTTGALPSTACPTLSVSLANESANHAAFSGGDCHVLSSGLRRAVV